MHFLLQTADVPVLIPAGDLNVSLGYRHLGYDCISELNCTYKCPQAQFEPGKVPSVQDKKGHATVAHSFWFSPPDIFHLVLCAHIDQRIMKKAPLASCC